MMARPLALRRSLNLDRDPPPSFAGEAPKPTDEGAETFTSSGGYELARRLGDPSSGRATARSEGRASSERPMRASSSLARGEGSTKRHRASGRRRPSSFWRVHAYVFRSAHLNWSMKYVYKSEYARGFARPASPLVVGDLCAQLISLNRYGAGPLGSAVVDVAVSVAGALRGALRFAFRRARCAEGLA